MLKLNETTLWATLRKSPFGGSLKQSQIDGVMLIIVEYNTRGLKDDRWLAYILATAFHETGGRMQPVRETFATSDNQAISRLENAWRLGKLKVSKPYWRKDKNGQSWFGRGLVQITHPENYKKFGITNPGDALDPAISVKIIFDGMIKGMFSAGHSLANYFNTAINDPVGARHIVNGSDRADLIAGYYKSFVDAINQAKKTYIDDGRTTDYIAPDIDPEAAKPDDVPPAQSKSLWTIAGTFLSGTTALPFLGNVTNGYALGAFALIVLAALIVAWLIYSGRITINRSHAIK